MTAVHCISVVNETSTMPSTSSELQSSNRHPPGLHRMLNYGREHGKVGWILLWLLGIPIPVLLVLFLVRGCT